MPSSASKHRQPPPPPQGPELVDPTFLLKGLGIILVVAFILAYVTLCVVYSRSQWQMVLHPSRTLATTPASVGLTHEEVHFGVDASGEPQLDGWWFAADAAHARTVLMLHGADGNMADALQTAAMFHQQRLNVLLFDYRGYGLSGGDHPTEALMRADARSALDYLTQTRGIHASDLVLYGHDLGVPLALDLCTTGHIECPALILDAPDGDTRSRVLKATRSRAVPATLLFHDTFALAAPLATYPGPRLVILHSNDQPPAIFRNGKSGSMTLSVLPDDAAGLQAGIQRFLEDHQPND
jgi:pimeloyl-ACP methyl ester carboxylesterase